jgi:hypothetical protein
VKDDTTTWIIVGVLALAVLWYLKRRKVVVAGGVGVVTTRPSVTVGGTTVKGGVAGSSLIQAGALGLAAAPAVSSLIESVGSWFSSPAVAGDAPADNSAATFGEPDSLTGDGSSGDDTYTDLLG